MFYRLVKPIHYLRNRYTFYRNNVKFGSNCSIRGVILLFGNVVLGNNVTINSGFKYNPIGGQERTSLVTHGNGVIEIGNNVGISNSSIVSRERVVIEDDVMIGGSCKIYDTDFHSLDYDERMSRPDPGIKSAPVTIKKGAFIGAHSVILKGVTIGEKSIVGAGAVVTKSIPDGEIWAGNPAGFIKKIATREITEDAQN